MISTRVAYEASDYITTIADLAHLIRLDAEHPETVKGYAEQIQERALSLGKLLESVRRDIDFTKMRDLTTTQGDSNNP